MAKGMGGVVLNMEGTPCKKCNTMTVEILKKHNKEKEEITVIYYCLRCQKLIRKETKKKPKGLIL